MPVCVFAYDIINKAYENKGSLYSLIETKIEADVRKKPANTTYIVNCHNPGEYIFELHRYIRDELQINENDIKLYFATVTQEYTIENGKVNAISEY